MLIPKQSLLQGKEYVPSDKTDVTKTWAKFGWKPTQNKRVRKQYRPIERN